MLVVTKLMSQSHPCRSRKKIYYPGHYKLLNMMLEDVNLNSAKMGTWRPRTCWVALGGHNNETCSLAPGLSVLKRTHSVAGRHISIHGMDEHPACKTRLAESPGSYYEHVHQECVPSLIDYGEFRIFITLNVTHRVARLTARRDALQIGPSDPPHHICTEPGLTIVNLLVVFYKPIDLR
jgi:hypothetical protein